MPAWSARPPLDRATTGSRRCSGDHPRGRTMSITQERVVDQDVLDEFMGRFVQELGGSVPGADSHHRRSAGALPRAGRGRPVHLGRAGHRHRHPRAVRPRVASGPGGRRLRELRPGDRRVLLDARAVLHVGSTGQSGIHPGRLPDGGGDRSSRACHHRGVHHRRRIRLAPTSSRSLRGRRALLSARLLRQPGVLLAAGARRCGREADRRGSGRRRGLRPWRLHDLDGSGLPEVAVHRLRLPRAVDRARHPAGGRGRVDRQLLVRCRRRRRLSRR